MGLPYLSLLDLSRSIRLGRIRAIDAVDGMLARIDELDGSLGAYSFVDGESARRVAAELDAELAAGRWRGPLHGIPLAVKDIFDVAGWPSEIGMRARRGIVSTDTATVVQRLRDAGAIILGKVHTTEGVYAEHTPPFRAPRNPWNADRWIGASSSGSAAAAAGGMAFAALASDTGGSIRMPSAATGTTGLKPTWGRVSRAGVFELAGTLDHVGVIARSAADTATVLQVIAGHDTADPTSALAPVPLYPGAPGSLRGVRLGVDTRWLVEDVSEDVSAATFALVDSLVALGADVVPVRLPDPTQINDDWFTVCGVQAERVHRATLRETPELYGPALTTLLTEAAGCSAADYQATLDRREAFTGRLREQLASVDALVLPALPFVAPPAAEMRVMSPEVVARIHRFTVPFTMSGLPSLTLPIGFDDDGMPIAGQIVTDRFDEATAIRIGIAYQARSEWHLRQALDG